VCRACAALTRWSFPAKLRRFPIIKEAFLILFVSKKYSRSHLYVLSLFRERVDITGLAKGLLFLFLLNFSGYALSGDKEAGEARYKKTCINCHGPAGKGAASYCLQSL
jgi:cytochrome c553